MEKLKQVGALFLYAGVDPEKLKRVSGNISESNRRAVTVFSAIALAFLAVMVLISVFNPALHAALGLYIVSSVMMLIICALSAGPAQRNEPLINSMMYLFAGSLLMFGIMLGTVGTPNELTAAYIALLLTVPQVFTDRPWRMCVMIAASVAVFIVMALHFKSPETHNSDIINALVFGSVSAMASTWMMRLKVERYCLEDTVRSMAETDMLTGLKNRNSYEQRLMQTDMQHADALYCVYVDVNGLHELNDAQGHEAGDRMLQYVAAVLQNSFGASDTYRIGGDEYVAIGMNLREQDVNERMSRVKIAVEAAGYHAAMGAACSSMPQMALADLIKSAEKRMYQDKDAYYQRIGVERRRRDA